VSAQAKTIWQTAGTYSARNFQWDILLITNRLCVAIFAKGLSAVANRLSLFQGVAQRRVVEENQQAIAPVATLKERAQSAIKRGNN